MSTQTLAALRQLKLGGMANALQSQLEQVGTYEGLAFSERLALLVEQETLTREQGNDLAAGFCRIRGIIETLRFVRFQATCFQLRRQPPKFS